MYGEKNFSLEKFHKKLKNDSRERDRMIPFGLKEDSKRHSVFVSIYCRNGKPRSVEDIVNSYRTLDGVERSKDLIPLILMVQRWDGRIGFPGGAVDEGESLEDAVRRELEEEINVKFPLNLVPILSYGNNTHISHLYASEISFEDLMKIQKEAIYSTCYFREILGVTLVPIYNYDKKRGLPYFLMNNFVGNVREDLIYLILKQKLMEEANLRKIVKRVSVKMNDIKLFHTIEHRFSD